METAYKENLISRMKDEDKYFEVIVINYCKGKEMTSKVESIFATLEEALHKIELDLMTNLHNGFELPIGVSIKEVSKNV